MAAQPGARMQAAASSSLRHCGTWQIRNRAEYVRQERSPSGRAGAMTSGEVTHRALSDPRHAYGRRCMHITWGARGAVDVSALAVDVVTDPREADFVLAHGTQGQGLPGGGVERRSMEELRALLRRCGEAGVGPMVLANPDVVTVSGRAASLSAPLL
jgi:hypothetical protein